MKYTFNLVLILLLSIQGFSQTNLEIVKNSVDSTIVLDQKFNLIMISHSNCGHCLIALRELQAVHEFMEIIVVNFGSYEKTIELSEKYPYVFLDGEKIESLSRQKFFPRFFLYKNNDLVWKGKGWLDKSLQKIKRELK